MPDSFSDPMPRVYQGPNEKPRDTQLRWEFVAKQEDRAKLACPAFYNDLKRSFSTAPIDLTNRN